MPDTPKIRLYVDDDLAAGAALGLAPSQAHYLRHVMRLDAGEQIALFNGRDGEWQGRIDGFGKGWCSLAVVEQLRGQASEPDIWLVFAPLKRARIDYIAQKATELGVAALWPVFTQNTAVSRVNTERLRANAVEAAEQCGRLSVPEIFAPSSLAECFAAWSPERRVLFCDHVDGAPVAAVLGAALAGPWAVLAGPEGGLTAAERNRLRRLPFVTAVSLGPRILRAETAALAALSLWQAAVGDWRA